VNGRDEDGGFDSLGSLFTHFTHHAVVPAAIIAMVASLLFYLVDVRSAFLGGGPSLKWIGFCFAVATVLIERYRHQGVMGDADLQGCYTVALLGATVLVMLVAPWEEHSASAGERLANLLIIAAVWRFATGVTRGLSPEADRPSRPGLRLYGLERLRVGSKRPGSPAYSISFWARRSQGPCRRTRLSPWRVWPASPFSPLLWGSPSSSTPPPRRA
jgi:hypothetical protein